MMRRHGSARSAGLASPAARALLVGAAVLLAIPWAGVRAQPTPHPPAPTDLAVTAFVLRGPVPGWTDGVGNTTWVQATVTNVGDVPSSYRLDYHWVDAAGIHPLDEDESSSVDVGQPLAAHTSYTHPPVQWRLQPGQAGAGAIQAQVHLSDNPADVDSDPTNDARSIPVFVAVHALSFTPPASGMQIPPDGTGFQRVRVRNDGNVPETLGVTLVNPPADARLKPILGSPAITLPAQSATNATLFVDYDPAGDFTPWSASYTVQLAPGFRAPVRLTLPPLTGGPEDTDTSGYAFTVHADLDHVQAPAGGSAVSTITVANTGNRSDAYLLHVVADPGWSGLAEAQDAHGADLRIALDPGQQVAVPVRIRPPTGSAAGTTGEVDVHVRSRLVPSEGLAAIAGEVPGAILTIDGLSLDRPTIYVGEHGRARVTVGNHGSLASGSGDQLKLAMHLPGLVDSAAVAALPTVPPGGTATVGFDLPELARSIADASVVPVKRKPAFTSVA